MKEISKSGLYVSNALARTTLLALEDSMGKRGLDTLLNLANLPHLINSYPENNFDRSVDFSEFSMLNGALDELYGAHGSRSLALSAGRTIFKATQGMFGSRVGMESPLFADLPEHEKLLLGLQGIALTYSQTTDQKTILTESHEGFLITLEACPQCYGRVSASPCCHIMAGLLMAALKWLSTGSDYRVTETQCKAKGDEVCKYLIPCGPNL